MANMSDFNEAREWLAEQMPKAKAGSEAARRFIARTAAEQRANFEAVKTSGNHLHLRWCNLKEYERSVRLIEAAAASLGKQ